MERPVVEEGGGHEPPPVALRDEGGVQTALVIDRAVDAVDAATLRQLRDVHGDVDPDQDPRHLRACALEGCAGAGRAHLRVHHEDAHPAAAEHLRRDVAPELLLGEAVRAPEGVGDLIEDYFAAAKLGRHKPNGRPKRKSTLDDEQSYYDRLIKPKFGQLPVAEFQRADLQRLLRARIDMISEGVLVVAEEFGAFAGAHRPTRRGLRPQVPPRPGVRAAVAPASCKYSANQSRRSDRHEEPPNRTRRH